MRARAKAFFLPHWLRRSTVSHWLALFLFANIFFEITGGPNPNSRLATIFAIIEEQSFRIDTYRFWTTDWAKTPDGHYYSNKAPAAAFLGVIPVAVLDAAIVGWHHSRPERDHFRWERKQALLRFASLCLQVIPFIYLVAFFAHYLTLQGVVASTVQWSAVALLFGNTASILMNSFFGHAIAANFLFAALLAMLTSNAGWFGLAIGWAALSDYGSLFVVPFLVTAWIFLPSKKSMKQRLLHFAAGLFLPVLLWILYHTACFGDPWTLPQRFQNPEFQDLKGQANALWGVISFLPNFEVLRELLVGRSRGLLYTQPWILFILVVLPIYFKRLKSNDRIIAAAIYLGLISLLLMNSSFGQWHGGQTIGPRYLCVVFPCFGYLLTLLMPLTSWIGRTALKAGVVAAAAFGFAVFLTNLTPVIVLPLWETYVRHIILDPNGTTLLRAVFLIPALAFALNKSIRMSRGKKAKRKS